MQVGSVPAVDVWIALALELTLAVLYLWAVHRTAAKAERKSYGFFSALAFFFLIPAAVIAEVLPYNHPSAGDTVKLLTKTQLDNGTILPKRHRATVLTTDLAHNPPLVQIETNGHQPWLARSNMRKV